MRSGTSGSCDVSISDVCDVPVEVVLDEEAVLAEDDDAEKEADLSVKVDGSAQEGDGSARLASEE